MIIMIIMIVLWIRYESVCLQRIQSEYSPDRMTIVSVGLESIQRKTIKW